jgi:GTPase SAR1 family protein
MKVEEIENPNAKRLKITPLKYTSDDIDSSIPHPLPQSFSWFFMLVGKPRSGKTTLLFNLIAKRYKGYNQKFDKVLVFSPSIFGGNLKENPLDNLPEENKFISLDSLEEEVQKIYGTDDRVLFILDDIQAEIKGDKLNTLLDLVNNRRHYTTGGCSIILCTQVWIQIPLSIRKGVSHVFFWSSKNRKEIKSVHEEYLSHLSDDELKKILKFTWRKTHDFLLISTYQSQDKMLFRNWNQIILDD